MTNLLCLHYLLAAAQRWRSAAAAGLTRLHFDYRATSKNALLAERRSRCPLEPVLGRIGVELKTHLIYKSEGRYYLTNSLFETSFGFFQYSHD
jgi:hypothetical protein